jgi:hypothetical protein
MKTRTTWATRFRMVDRILIILKLKFPKLQMNSGPCLLLQYRQVGFPHTVDEFRTCLLL